MYFYAIYAANIETVLINKCEYSTDEFHELCEQAPTIRINDKDEHSLEYIVEWLTEFYGFQPVPYHATFHMY